MIGMTTKLHERIVVYYGASAEVSKVKNGRFGYT